MRSTIIKTLALPLADKAMNTNVASYYKQIKKMGEYSANVIEHWQNAQLQNLLKHAYTHTVYYKTLFDNNQLRPDDIQTREDLHKLPILEKQDVIKNFEDLVATNIQNIPHKKSATGGSSGNPMPYLLDHRSWSFSNANTIFNWEKTEYHYGDKHISLGSTSLFVDKNPSIKHMLYYRLKNKIGLNGVNMSPVVCKSYIDLIKKKKIRFIYGYASAIYLLAKFCMKANQGLDIRACFTTSEVLTDLFRKTIEEAFQCTIVDCYGAHDGGITAFSHNKGFFEVGYNSMVHLENPNSDGIGPALLTDLFNYAMPLINYKLGDEILIDEPRNMACDYNGQIINQVLGRTSDIIELENSNTLTGPGFTILFKDLPVEHYCIEKTGINAIKCHIVKLPGYTQHHEKLVQSTFKKQMGPDSFFSINYTMKIPVTKSGKRLYFKTNH